MLPLLSLLAGCGLSSGVIGPVDIATDDSQPDESVQTAGGDEVPNWLVDCEGGGDFETLSDAIDAADDGDLIAVAPCTYRETLDLQGKSVEVVSTDGPDSTIIQPSGNGAAILANNGEGTGTRVEGFTLTGGGGGSYAAVDVQFASLHLVDSIVENSRGYVTILADSADVELTDVTLSGNNPSYGYDIYMSKGALLATGLDLTCDGASVGAFLGHGATIIDWSVIDCPRGSSTDWEHTVGRIQRSVLSGGMIVLTEDDHYDDTVYLQSSVLDGALTATYGTMKVRNAVVMGGISLTTTYLDTTIEGSILTDARCAITSDSAKFTVRNNIFWDNNSNACSKTTDPIGNDDNIEADPEFSDAANGDYTLQAGSPAIDAGPDDDNYDDPDGSRNDIGAYGGPLSMGGGW
jgi:hypothetical protein